VLVCRPLVRGGGLHSCGIFGMHLTLAIRLCEMSAVGVFNERVNKVLVVAIWDTCPPTRVQFRYPSLLWLIAVLGPMPVLCLFFRRREAGGAEHADFAPFLRTAHVPVLEYLFLAPFPFPALQYLPSVWLLVRGCRMIAAG